MTPDQVREALRARRAQRLTAHLDPTATGQPAPATAEVGPASSPAAAPAPAQTAATPPAPPGHVLLDAATLAELHRQAGLPEQIAQDRARHQRAHVIRAALERGAITPHQGRSWDKLLAADPAALADLERVPDGASGIPLTEIGHAGPSPTNHDDRDGWFDRGAAAYTNRNTR